MNTSSDKSILAIGELLWDLLPQGAVLGGAPANMAVQLHQRGGSVKLVGRIGKDENGRKALKYLQSLGIDTSLIQQDQNKPTGTVPVSLDKNGNPSFEILQDVAYDYIECTDEMKQAAGKASLICFGTLIQRSITAQKALFSLLDSAPKVPRLLDINLRKNCYTPATVDASLAHATILKLNRSEVKVLRELLGLPKGGDIRFFCEALKGRYPNLTTFLVTLGEAGVYAYAANGDEAYEPGFKVTVADTVGAGDAFTAGFSLNFVQGRSLAECCRWGNLLGSLSATKNGGMGIIPDGELARFLENPLPRHSESDYVRLD